MFGPRRARLLARLSAWILAAVLIGANVLVGPHVLAGSLPNSYTQSYYVQSTWTTTSAYNLGYNDAISSNGYTAIVLDFGAQQDSSGWGVYLTSSNTAETDSWVSGIANAFIRGYSAGHTKFGYVFVGTNNDTGWSHGSSLWGTAASTWEGVVSGLTGYSNAMYEAGSDIESWYCAGCGFVAYGSDAMTWVSDYNTAGGLRLRLILAGGLGPRRGSGATRLCTARASGQLGGGGLGWGCHLTEGLQEPA